MEKHAIKLINQKKNGCALVCVAMVSNQSLEVVEEAFPTFNGVGTTAKELTAILDALDVLHIVYASETIFMDRVYILTVPSLNIKGGLHNIVASLDNNAEISIFDPVQGLPDKLYYSEDEGGANAVKLLSWSASVEIVSWGND